MIDHISIAVRDLKKAEPFYAALLAPLGMAKLREWPDAAIGFGKKYPDSGSTAARRWTVSPRTAACISACARRTPPPSMPFMPRHLAGGGSSDGAPGLRTKYHSNYYAAFIRDPDGNRIEAVTFLRDAAVCIPDRSSSDSRDPFTERRGFRAHAAVAGMTVTSARPASSSSSRRR